MRLDWLAALALAALVHLVDPPASPAIGFAATALRAVVLLGAFRFARRETERRAGFLARAAMPLAVVFVTAALITAGLVRTPAVCTSEDDRIGPLCTQQASEPSPAGRARAAFEMLGLVTLPMCAGVFVGRRRRDARKAPAPRPVVAGPRFAPDDVTTEDANALPVGARSTPPAPAAIVR